MDVSNNLKIQNTSQLIFLPTLLPNELALNVYTPVKLYKFEESDSESTIQCNIIGRSFKLTWYLDMQPILNPKLNGTNLVIKNNRTSSGSYMCYALKDGDEMSDITTVEIFHPPHKPRVFIGHNEIINVISLFEKDITNGIFLKCVSAGPNLKYYWTDNLRNLSNSDEMFIDFDTLFKIKPAVYQCIVSNAHGLNNSSITINVIPHRVFGPWKSWSECSSSCGMSLRTRSRDCFDSKNNYVPVEECTKYAQIIESYSDLENCWKPACPIHGEWSDWSPWSDCNASCTKTKFDKAERRRTRKCDSPAPSPDGNECIGHSFETLECTHIPLCPFDGKWSNWSSWSKCPNCYFNENIHTSNRTRECYDLLGKESNCHGNAIEIKKCDIKKCSADNCADVECPNTKGFTKQCSQTTFINYCEDIDECKIKGKQLCPKGICVNNIGGYKCKCKIGFEVSKTNSRCHDINECELNPSICNIIKNSLCLNTIGSYRCLCPQETTFTNGECAFV